MPSEYVVYLLNALMKCCESNHVFHLELNTKSLSTMKKNLFFKIWK